MSIFKTVGRVGLGLTIMSFLSACNLNHGETSKVSFVIPKFNGQNKVGAQDVSILGILIIRVTGVGVDQVEYNWSLEAECRKIVGCDVDNGLNLPSPPSEIALDVSKGQRTIQVLAFTIGEGGRMTPNYGDVSKNISSDIESVKVNLTAFGSAGPEATVAGRYMTSATGGPTGTLQMFFNPPSGAPPMEILKSDIINGYFEAIFLKDTKFTYKVKETGLVLFDNKTQAEMMALVKSDSLLKFPATVYYRNNGNCEKEERGIVFGFFGQVPANAKVCKEGAVSYIYPDNQCDYMNPLTSLPNEGGIASCTGIAGSDLGLRLQMSQFRNGHDNVVGFKGPFKLQYLGADYYDYLGKTLGLNGYTFNWQYMDGGQATLDGHTLFYSRIPGFNPDKFEGLNGIDCESLTKTSMQQLNVGATDTSALVPFADLTGVILCPYRNSSGKKVYLSSAIKAHDLERNAYPDGKMTIAAIPEMGIDSCVNVTVNITPHAGVNMQGGTISPSISGSEYSVGPDCNNLSSSYSIPYSSGRVPQSVQFAVRLLTASVHTLEVYESSYKLQEASSFLVARNPSGTATGAKFAFADFRAEDGVFGYTAVKPLVAGKCYVGLLYPHDATGAPVSGTAYNAQVISSQGSIVQTYSDSSCSIATSSFPIPVASASVPVYVKAIGVGNSTLGFSGIMTVPSVLTRAGIAAYDHYEFASYLPATYTQQNYCTEVTVFTSNSAGSRFFPDHGTAFKVNVLSDAGTGVAIGSNPSECETSTSTESIFVNTYSQGNSFYYRFYVKTPTGASNMQIKVTSANGVVRTATLNYAP